MRVSNRDMRRCVQYKEEFKNNNETVWGKWYGDLYVVFSYGEHFPMYIYDSNMGLWLGNKDKYSRTTSCHQTHTRPASVEHWLDTDQMTTVYYAGGAAAYVAQQLAV